MQTPTKIDISEVVDKSRIGGFQIRIYIICALCLIMELEDLKRRSDPGFHGRAFWRIGRITLIQHGGR